MNLSTMTVAAAGVLAMGGIMLIWWLTSRPVFSRIVRTLARVVAVPAFIGIAGVLALSDNQAQATAVPQAAIVPSERMTVQTGTLIVSLNATGSLAAADQSTLTFSSIAPVAEVLVSAGDRVRAGDVLARIQTTTLDAQVRSAELNLTAAENTLAALKEPASELEIEIAKTQVEAARASLSSASLSGASEQDIEIARLKVELAKNSLYQAQLSRDAAVARGQYNPNMVVNAYANEIKQDAQLEQSDNSITSAQISYEATLNDGPDASALASGNASLISAQANLDSLLAGPTDAELRQAEISVETARLALETAQRNLTQAVLVAPFDGLVAAVDFVEGTLSSSGSITLINTSAYTITLSVDEKDITQLAVGQPVTLRVPALDTAAVAGKVTRIDLAPATSESGQLVTYSVQVTLDTTEAALRPGLSAIATVTLNEVKNVIVVPNRFITVDATTQQATVKVETADGVYEDIPVTLGTRTDSESAVTGGLSVGQTLVILPTASEAAAAEGGFNLFGGGGMPGGAMPSGGMPSGGPPSGGMPGGGRMGGG